MSQTGGLKEIWCLRCQLWVAIVRFWLSELHVRICLIRYCVAIYRRELTAHKYEAARIARDRVVEEPDW